MSATIESLLKDPRMAGADQLVLQAGKVPTVFNSSGATELTRSPMTPFDIYRLLQPHLPDDKKTALMSQPTTNFRLNVNGAGTFDVSITKEGGGMKVSFVPVDSAPARPATPSAPIPPPRIQTLWNVYSDTYSGNQHHPTPPDPADSAHPPGAPSPDTGFRDDRAGTGIRAAAGGQPASFHHWLQPLCGPGAQSGNNRCGCGRPPAQARSARN